MNMFLQIEYVASNKLVKVAGRYILLSATLGTILFIFFPGSYAVCGNATADVNTFLNIYLY